MARLKRWLRRLFCLPPLVTVLVAIPSLVLVAVVLASPLRESPAAYVVYVAAAYGLAVLVIGFPRLVRSVRQKFAGSRVTQAALAHPLGKRLSDPLFRAKLSLYGSLALNLVYAIWKLSAGVYYRSLWFGTLAVYYMLLALLRFFLVRYVQRHPIGESLAGEWRRYRLCGVFLLVMHQALVGIVFLIVYQNRGYAYGGLLIFLVAMYAFYAITAAIVSLVKARRRGSPVLSAAKAVQLTAAMVSMLALETAMLARFNTEGPDFRRLMTGITGAGVCVLILAMAILMIVRGTKALRRLRG